MFPIFLVIFGSAMAAASSVLFINIFEHSETLNRTADQKFVNTFLKYAARQHSEIMRSGRQLNEVGGSLMLYFSLNAVVTLTGCLYIIITAQYRDLNIASIMFKWISTAVTLCFCGQKLTDTSSELYDVLISLPWYTWNQQNKRLYHILLMNSRKGMAFSFYGMRSINYAYVQDVFRGVYSLACVGCNLK
ncbi:unnamed protein product [Acanthoscelides obtectus]|nr:unnamed protein product [Acanthoscelides obtectus]CAK1674469.1 hypothetical protein AOBTE_LOCUS29631 [Acanthoscelides obtectus]